MNELYFTYLDFVIVINNTGDNGMETFVKVQSKLSGVMDAFFEITSSKSYPVTST